MDSLIVQTSSIKSRLNIIKNHIDQCIQPVGIIGVTKMQSVTNIVNAIDAGMIHFGENYLNEAQEKWFTLKTQYPHIKLHFIGNLQNNKINKIMTLFDSIHSIHNMDNASKIKAYLDANPSVKNKEFFIQVQLYDNLSKGGIHISQLDGLIHHCQQISLRISGLMYVSSSHNNSDVEFAEISRINAKYGFPFLSMGMSNDYELALKYGATYLRIGEKIFGQRA